MKSSIASNMFMNQPRLYGVRAMWRTTGTKTTIMSTDAISSITMKRVICNPEDLREVNLQIERGRVPPRDFEGVVVDDVGQGIFRVSSHGV